MIPDYRLSTTSIRSSIIGARGRGTATLMDYEDGGIAISDPSQGLRVQVWRGQLVGQNVVIVAESTLEEMVVYNGSRVTEFSFTFDQNMRPVVTVIDVNRIKLRFYDSFIADYTTEDFGNTWSNPRVFLDDKRQPMLAVSDVILAYIRAGNLYMRLQRDRYGVEYFLRDNASGLHTFGMGKNWRLQFHMK